MSCEEFLEAIDAVPLPVLKHPVGYQTAMPRPATFLRERQAFQVWPTTVDLGQFLWRRVAPPRGVSGGSGSGSGRSGGGPTAGGGGAVCRLTVRNVGYAECRFRVRVRHLDGRKGQACAVTEQPRGLVAPGLRGAVAVEFFAAKPGSLTAIVSIETEDQVT